MLISILMGLIGAALASFSSVLVARSDYPRSVIWAADGTPARSRCPSCGRVLTALDLLPLFGWLLACGRCRGCGSKIGLWYLVLEGIGAAVMIAVFMVFSWSLALVVFACLLPFLLALGCLTVLRRPVPGVYWGCTVGLLLAFLFVL